MSKKVCVYKDEPEAVTALCSLIQTKSNEAIAARSLFTVGLSGGSVIKFLATGLPGIQTDWSKWRMFYCDERIVPFNDPESTFGGYKEKLIGKVPLQESQFINIDPNLPVEAAAVDYEKKLKAFFPNQALPKFDLLLLGMGPDGHTCSLFPGHFLLKETSRWVAPISDSPKPPPCRVTLTFPVVNNARCIIFASTGASKAQILKRILEGNESDPLPSARVNPTAGELYWILDKPAAQLLTNK